MSCRGVRVFPSTAGRSGAVIRWLDERSDIRLPRLRGRADHTLESFPLILGITGSIGCGKSTVLAMFADAGWRTADADRICRRMYDDPSGELAAQCRREWGDAFFTSGIFDRAKIAAVVFGDPGALRKLTGFMYPVLTRELETFIASAREAGCHAAVEVPLLYESGMETLFDAVLTVWAPKELRHRRLRELRGFDATEIRRREALQMDADEKLERADYALVNSGSSADLKEEFEVLLSRVSK